MLSGFWLCKGPALRYLRRPPCESRLSQLFACFWQSAGLAQRPTHRTISRWKSLRPERLITRMELLRRETMSRFTSAIQTSTPTTRDIIPRPTIYRWKEMCASIETSNFIFPITAFTTSTRRRFAQLRCARNTILILLEAILLPPSPKTVTWYKMEALRHMIHRNPTFIFVRELFGFMKKIMSFSKM